MGDLLAGIARHVKTGLINLSLTGTGALKGHRTLIALNGGCGGGLKQNSLSRVRSSVGVYVSSAFSSTVGYMYCFELRGRMADAFRGFSIKPWCSPRDGMAANIGASIQQSTLYGSHLLRWVLM